MDIIAATNNAHKISEIKNKLADKKNLNIIPLNSLENAPEIIENGITFEENALIKARTIKNICENPVISDDSGLVVDFLDGEPGIYSARYGNLPTDSEKNSLILSKLSNTPWEKRTAKFVCVIVFIMNDLSEHIVRGECSGYITMQPSGEHGFGYDPIFYVPEYEKTMAELPISIKNKISHRAIALDKFSQTMNNLTKTG
jgi:XTP/dITP diphosphohydrolase